MNNFKRVIAWALLLVMALSVVGCHKKDETAVTVGDVEFTSAYYMCALINADSQGKSKVEENLASEDSDTSGTSSTDIDYYKEKIDDKDFATWVEDTAIDNLKKIAAYKTLCKEADIELTDENIKGAESYASYYWSNGYSSYFEPNGVSQSTYTSYMKDAYYSNLYFEHLYGKDGEKAIDAETVKSAIYENFVIADKLEVSFSGKTADEITALTDKVNGYVAALNGKSMTFEQVYKDYNGSTEEDASADTDATETQPADKYASVLGTKGTTYESEYYDTAKEMQLGEVKLVTEENNAGLVLLVKQDITTDPYYIDNLDLTARHILKDDEYKDYIESYVKDLDCNISKYATSQFKVKKIKEPSSSSK